MGQEIDLMRFYPKPKNRLSERPLITEADREISRRFDAEYFDGDRRYGYGGFTYNPRFWTDTVNLFVQHYGLSENAAILDVGCGKGFMLKDFQTRLPQARLAGVDISSYAIENAHPDVQSLVQLADARRLPFKDDSFDLVLSINTLHNLQYEECVEAFREVQRVSRRHAFVMVDGWKNAKEREELESWVLTAYTMLSAEAWRDLMASAQYTGDYEFWSPGA